MGDVFLSMAVFTFVFLSLATGLLPLIASDFFDSLLTPGFFCFDLFLLLGLFFVKRSLVWQLICSLPLLVFSCINGNLYFLSLSIYYFAVTLISFVLYSSLKLRFFSFVLILLFIIVCSWSLFFESAFSMSLGELWGIAKFFWWGCVLFFLVPILQIGIVLFFMRRIIFLTNLHVHCASFVIITIALLLIHFISDSIQKRQPVLDFPVYSFIKQQLQPGRITQNSILRKDAKEKFLVANDVDGDGILDSLKLNDIRPTVMVLVESWGFRKEFQMNLDEFSVFDSNKVSFKGIWRRQGNYTQSAEYEDFEISQSPKETLVERYRDLNFDTWYVHGYDGEFYEREEKYNAIGFNHLKFKENLSAQGLNRCNYGFEGICDSSVVQFLDALLTDSVPKFVYWTTLDSHPPFETQKRPDDKICFGLNDVECIHTVRIRNSLKQISLLAEKHPEYRFVLRGDHRPMGSLTSSGFVTSFYHCWVPVIVLN